jgi:hypothetical protein
MEIDLGKVPFTMDFHPSDNLVTAGLITGDLHLLVNSSFALVLSTFYHSRNCFQFMFGLVFDRLNFLVIDTVSMLIPHHKGTIMQRKKSSSLF